MRYFILLMLSLSFPVQAARYALVIGNANYPPFEHNINHATDLPNAEHDAQDIADFLSQDLPKEHRFQVTLLKDANQQQMDTAIKRFEQKLQAGDVAIFYFSGHGVRLFDIEQKENVNYLLPVAYNFANGTDVKFHAINAKAILDRMNGYDPNRPKAARQKLTSIMILDACQEKIIYDGSKSTTPPAGFSAMGGEGVLVAYAAAQDQLAYTDSAMRNSLFTGHLLEQMRIGLHESFETIINRTADKVMSQTEGTDKYQSPWKEGIMRGIFCLARCPSTPLDVTAQLRLCANYFQRDWLTTNPILGAEKTALHCYRQVLQIDSQNQTAWQGIEDMESRYLTWTDKAMQQQDWMQARVYLDRVQMINPESSRLMAARDSLAAASGAPIPSQDSPQNGIQQENIFETMLKILSGLGGLIVILLATLFISKKRAAARRKAQREAQIQAEKLAAAQKAEAAKAQQAREEAARRKAQREAQIQAEKLAAAQKAEAAKAQQEREEAARRKAQREAQIQAEKARKDREAAAESLANGRYLAHDDGTVLDKKTNLIWMRCALGQTWNKHTKCCEGDAIRMTWKKACAQKNYNFAGYRDWRVPTIEELRTLIDKKQEGATIHHEAFPNCPADWFWSGSPVSGSTHYAWVVNVNYGNDSTNGRGNDGHVRLVRERQ